MNSSTTVLGPRVWKLLQGSEYAPSCSHEKVVKLDEAVSSWKSSICYNSVGVAWSLAAIISNILPALSMTQVEQAETEQGFSWSCFTRAGGGMKQAVRNIKV